MTDELNYTLTFHTPFRVGASHGRDGTHLLVDTDEPVAAAHLKGLMRAAATMVLQLPDHLVDQVFGARVPRRPGIAARSGGPQCPWAWSAAQPLQQWGRPRLRTRISIDPEHHAVREDHLVVAEQLPATTATFTVTRHRALSADQIETHLLVLRCAGAAVHGLGGWRRRGLGWVGITPHPAITAADVAVLQRRREEI